jgi:hypothetical protein
MSLWFLRWNWQVNKNIEKIAFILYKLPWMAEYSFGPISSKGIPNEEASYVCGALRHDWLG